MWGPPTSADHESVQSLTDVQIADIADGASCSEVSRVAQGPLVEPDVNFKTNRKESATMCVPDDTAGDLIDAERTPMCAPDGTAGVHTTQIGRRVEVGCPGCLPTSGMRDPATGYVCCKQIKYDMSDFLGSCVRLCKDFANSHDETLSPAYTPFLEENGDDYGLGGGVCDEVPDDKRETDTWMDIERTLQELAQTHVLAKSEADFAVASVTMTTLKLPCVDVLMSQWTDITV
jgi:hypothetical protein